MDKKVVTSVQGRYPESIINMAKILSILAGFSIPLFIYRLIKPQFLEFINGTSHELPFPTLIISLLSLLTKYSRIFHGSCLLISIMVLVCCIGLLKGQEWARKILIGIMALIITWEVLILIMLWLFIPISQSVLLAYRIIGTIIVGMFIVLLIWIINILLKGRKWEKWEHSL